MKMPFMQTFAWKIAEFFHVCRTVSSKLNNVLIFCYTILTQDKHRIYTICRNIMNLWLIVKAFSFSDTSEERFTLLLTWFQ